MKLLVIEPFHHPVDGDLVAPRSFLEGDRARAVADDPELARRCSRVADGGAAPGDAEPPEAATQPEAAAAAEFPVAPLGDDDHHLAVKE